MKRGFTIACLMLFVIASSFAQEAKSQESWSGEILAGSRKLHIGFNFQSSADGKRTCTMDVPDQGAKYIPVEVIKNDSDSLSISIATLRALSLIHI